MYFQRMKPIAESSQSYFHGLDGLRFLAFMVVLGSHLTHPLSERFKEGALGYFLSWFQYGYLAVDLFFVLSAFLISWWGLREIQHKNDFSFGKYFVRRALRIWPLYFLMVLICLLIIQLQSGTGMKISDMPSLWYYFTFTLNFAALEEDQFLMVILWSISVEEQFYIFNGLVLKFLRKYFLVINLLAFAASAVFRIIFLDQPLTLHYHSFSVMACFAAGNILAYAITHKSWSLKLKEFFNGKSANISFWVLMLVLAFYPVLAEITWIYAIEKIWIPVLFAGAVAYQTFRSSGLFSLHNRRALNYLGKISYGLYCFHGLVIAVLINLLQLAGFQYPPLSPFVALVIFPVTSLGLTILLAHFSYRWFELPILNYKNRFR